MSEKNDKESPNFIISHMLSAMLSPRESVRIPPSLLERLGDEIFMYIVPTFEKALSSERSLLGGMWDDMMIRELRLCDDEVYEDEKLLWLSSPNPIMTYLKV